MMLWIIPKSCTWNEGNGRFDTPFPFASEEDDRDPVAAEAECFRFVTLLSGSVSLAAEVPFERGRNA